MKWTAEADRIVITRWKAGDSIAQIMLALKAAGYAVTKNMVVGRRWRCRALISSKGPNPVLRPMRPKPNGHRAVEHNSGVEYLQLTDDGCKAILDKRGGDGLPMCCGRLRCVDHLGTRTSYCSDHYAAYVNFKPREARHG